MRPLRPILLAVVIAGAFFYFTTYRHAGFRPANWLGRPHKVEITEAAGGEPLDAEEQNNIRVYHNNIPAVVNITSRAVTFDFFYGLVPQEGQGSGFIIDKEGHILTNYHVVADARQVEVTLHNRKKYRANVVGMDKAHDLAVIQISAPNLTSSVLGDSRNLQSRPESVCHRQPIRTGWHDDTRHCEFDPLGARARWHDHRRSHPDRRCHQPGQLRRSTYELAWRGNRY